MKKTLPILVMTGLLTLASAVALAFEPGERTLNLLGVTLNSNKHPVHIVITQTMDLKSVYTEEAYNKLPEEQRKIVNRTEYNEDKGIYAERNVKTDGAGNVRRDMGYFSKGRHWYGIDYLNKTYDAIPRLLNESVSFAESLGPWFKEKIVSGVDSATGYDYDEMKLVDPSNHNYKVLRFYYEAGTDKWVGYERPGTPLYKVEVYDEQVDPSAFDTPSHEAGYKKKANVFMRSHANASFAKMINRKK